MNRLILKLPNKLIQSYVLRNFSDISVEDFLLVVNKGIKIPSHYYSKNTLINSNSEVLKYVLENDFYSLDQFDIKAFNEENIEIIANSDNELYKSFIDKYLFLLNNIKIRKKIIKEYPFYIKFLTSEQLNDDIVKILEDSYYVVDKEDIEKFAKLLSNEKIMGRAIEKDPSLILSISNLNEKMISIILEKQFIPTREQFYKNPELQNYDMLILQAFLIDPSIIVFFKEDKLTYNNVKFAYERGFILTEDDLIKHPNLAYNTYLMNYAVKENPKLIRYIKIGCYLKDDVINYALNNYKITKEDLINNPDICKNNYIMYLLPEYKLYSAYLDEDIKKDAIIDCLIKGEEINDDRLPFFSKVFGSKLESKNLNLLVKILSLDINNDIQEQHMYYNLLDKIIDGVINIRYEQQKKSFKYNSIIDLKEQIEKVFIKIQNIKDFNLLKELINDIFEFTNKSLSLKYIKEEIINYYKIYNKENVLNISSEFSNKILNLHRDYYMSNEKHNILYGLYDKLELNEKKKKLILNSKKLDKISKYISEKTFEKLGITENDLEQLLFDLKISIQDNKDIKKLGYTITDDMFEKLVFNFKLYGYIPIRLFDNLKINNEEVIKYIINKFNKVKIKFIDKVVLDDKEYNISYKDKNKLSINANNFIIGDKKRYLENIALLLLNLNEEAVNNILYNTEYINEIKDIIPLVGLIDELNIETLSNILSQYSRSREKIISLNEVSNETVSRNLILDNFDDLITLSNSYCSIDDISLFALGKNIVSEIGDSKCEEYLDFYKKVLKKQNGFIPPIYLKTEKYIYESGVYSDPERLLIGKKTATKSCIYLNSNAGGVTFEECLNGKNGDVILIKDTLNNLVSRILVFRRGNVVQFVTNSNIDISLDIYKEFAKQIIEKSKENNDNIDYVFVNASSVKNIDNNELIRDKRFESKFPHADFSIDALLLNSKDLNKDKINLDFDLQAQSSYYKVRKKVNFNPTDEEITRLRALRIVLENDIILKEDLSRDFELFYSKEYLKVICGEDWYIALKKDGVLEEVILPLNNLKAIDELESVKSYILDESKNNIRSSK